MFNAGDHVRLNELGRASIALHWGSRPKRLAFYLGIHFVEIGFSTVSYLHYPIGLDVEDARFISHDRTFCIANDKLELVSSA